MILIVFLLVWVVLGIKAGAYRMAIHLFSLVIAVYAAVMSTPSLLQSGPKFFLPDWITALICLIAVGGLIFAGLDYFLFRFFVRGADSYFRPLVKMAGGAAFGLLFGHILWGCPADALLHDPLISLGVGGKIHCRATVPAPLLPYPLPGSARPSPRSAWTIPKLIQGILP
jgi:hypothetical protein